MSDGQVYIISAPSGAGKTSLIDALCSSMSSLVLSISHTTRPPRLNEKDKQHYYFVTLEAFNELLQKDEYLEHATIFDHYYGTSRKELDRQLKNGIDVILELDWQGAQQVRKLLSESISIFILPPARSTLKERLNQRGMDDGLIVDKRFAAASKEIAHYEEYDFLVVNDSFDIALTQLQSIIQSNRLKCSRQKKYHKELISNLLSPNE